MIITIDFDKKTIYLESNSVNIGDLISKLEEIIPNYKEYTLEIKEKLNTYYIPYRESNPFKSPLDQPKIWYK